MLVAKALGPVAGRSIVQERRMLLEARDIADARVRELYNELDATKDAIPAIRAREEAALDREEQIRYERDTA